MAITKAIPAKRHVDDTTIVVGPSSKLKLDGENLPSFPNVFHAKGFKPL